MDPCLPKGVADFGVIGLTEECKGILLEMHNLGYVGCVYDFDHAKVEAFFENEAKDTGILGAGSLEDLINNLKVPRCIVLLTEDIVIDDFVDVGFSTDDFIDERLLPHLSYRDYVIDATSSGAEVSKKKVDDFMSKGIRYAGIKNGGSVALLQGICICLENHRLWNAFDFEQSLKSRARKRRDIPAGEDKSCCCWGVDGKESYIHSVIADMSNKNDLLMHEVEKILSSGIDFLQLHRGVIFHDWSKSHLNSALLGDFESRHTRPGEVAPMNDDQKTFVEHLKKAALACQVINYARGFASIRELAELHQWDVDFAELKLEMPQNYLYKCDFYRKIRTAFEKNPKLTNLLLDENFAKVVDEGLTSIKKVICKVSSVPLEITGDSVTATDNNAIKKINVEEFTDALEYYEDFSSGKPVCAGLFDKNKMRNEEPKNEWDFSSLYEYQYQVRELLSTIGKIDDTIKKLNEQFGADDIAKRSAMDYHHRSTRGKIMKLHGQPRVAYEVCMKHLEKDEKVTAWHGIISERLGRVIAISKMYVNRTMPYY